MGAIGDRGVIYEIPFVEGFTELLEECNSWLDGLDRSKLGTFAVSRASLTFFYMASYSEALGKERLNEAIVSIGTPEHSVLIRGILKWEVSTSRAEALFWFERDSSLLLNAIVNRTKANASRQHSTVISDIERVRNIYTAQYAHPYFRMGVWDMGFIDSCIAEDIDPEMAATMRDGG